jgi:hypothetical protein
MGCMAQWEYRLADDKLGPLADAMLAEWVAAGWEPLSIAVAQTNFIYVVVLFRRPIPN